MLRLFDTATGEVVPFEPREPGKVSMYVCGPTVYGPPHLGHGRFSLVFDVLRRYLEWSGNEVTYVSNITDIDDQIINRANREGRTSEEVAVECEAVWWEAMDAIGVKRPTHDPHATAFVERMVEFIGELLEAGFAYETSDGIYFTPEAVDGYGLLARQSLDSLRSGARIDPGEEKRSPIDFVLWKKAKPGEPTWDAPWGAGRPGWHTECVVMSTDLLGREFDLHGGGQDLAFPHHENERAQAVAVGHPFARHWMHNGFVEVGGEKMSKSLGNYTTLVDLIESTDPRSYRLLVLRAHYRSPLEINRATTEDAAKALASIDAFARRTAGLPDAPPDADVLDRFVAAMDDDLDTPRAVALLFTTMTKANTRIDEGDHAGAAPLAAAVLSICRAVGLEIVDTSADVPPEVLAVARQRDEARAAKDWPRADALRDDLVALGYVVEDTPQGTQVRPA